MAARVKNPITVLGPDGRPLEGADVTIRHRVDGSVPDVYAAETGSTPADNPATSDVTGKVEQWVERGAYTITATHAELARAQVEPWDAAPASDGSITYPWTNRDIYDEYSRRPAATPELTGAVFHAYDKGTTYLCDGALWRLIAAEAMQVIALPADPVDGQQILYKGADAPPVGWRFRYNAGSASRYRWEAVGRQVASAIGFSGNLGVNVTAPAPGVYNMHLTVLLARPGLSGEYDILSAIHAQVGTSGTTNIFLALGRSAAGDNTIVHPDNVGWLTTQVANEGAQIVMPTRGELLAGSSYCIKGNHSSTGAWVSYARARIEFAPVRVG